MLSAGLYPAQQLWRQGDLALFHPDAYMLLVLLFALVILCATLIPHLALRLYIPPAFIYLAAGVLVFSLPLPWKLPDLVSQSRWPMHLTELGVLIALTSAGLKINHPFRWQSWRISWRLLAFTMPLTIAATAWLGWWLLGMLPATALLFGALIAPTDPVLASDVETTAPDSPDYSSTRLALTTEAGLNDGLAFPFTNLAIAVALVGTAPQQWLMGWLVVDVGYRIVVGVALGALSGWLLAKLLFGVPDRSRLARSMSSSVALSLTLLPYALTELAAGYGFIAVFVAACVFRQYESRHKYQQVLHDFTEEIERVLVAVLLFMLGAYIASGVLAPLTAPMVAVALATLLLTRPLTAWLGLLGSGLQPLQTTITAFYGIRGIGSFYYLAYAMQHARFAGSPQLVALVILIVVMSMTMHGLTANHAMALLDRKLEKR